MPTLKYSDLNSMKLTINTLRPETQTNCIAISKTEKNTVLNLSSKLPRDSKSKATIT